MTIIYLHQYFYTPSMNGGTRSYEFARRLAARGHTVHVVTSWHNGDGPNGNRTFVTNEHGVQVHWIPCAYSNRMSYARRIATFVLFAIASARVAYELGGNLVFATSTPLTIVLPALYASARRRIPMLFEVRDLWPDAAIAVGALRSRPLIALARRLEALAYRRSVHIVALSPAIRDGILRRNVPGEKVTLIPNGADLDVFSPDLDPGTIRADLSLTGKFVCVHLGAMGVVNGLEFVLDCARELKRRGNADVVFLLHGDGRNRSALEQRCRRERLDNVRFSGPSDKYTAARILAASDASLILVRNMPALHGCSPNKFFDTLAAGRPVLLNVNGWLQSATLAARAGLFIEPDNIQHFADQVMTLRDDPALCSELGRNARILAEQQYARDRLAEQLEALMLATVAEREITRADTAPVPQRSGHA